MTFEGTQHKPCHLFVFVFYEASPLTIFSLARINFQDGTCFQLLDSHSLLLDSHSRGSSRLQNFIPMHGGSDDAFPRTTLKSACHDVMLGQPIVIAALSSACHCCSPIFIVGGKFAKYFSWCKGFLMVLSNHFDTTKKRTYARTHKTYRFSRFIENHARCHPNLYIILQTLFSSVSR